MMDQLLYDSAKNDTIHNLYLNLQRVSHNQQVSLETILSQVSPSGDTVLHVAAGNDNVDITEHLPQQFPQLITHQNYQGETAIHFAARAGRINAVHTLISHAECIKAPDSLLAIKNNIGNTPLHEAVINKKVQVVRELVQAEPEVAYYENSQGVYNGEPVHQSKSPLYLAAEIGNVEMLDHLLQALTHDGADLLNKLQGKPPAVAAFKCTNSGVELERDPIKILKKIAEIKPELLGAKDDKGNTAFHVACSYGSLKGVEFFIQHYIGGAVEMNKQGFLPIHVACQYGKLDVIIELLKQWRYPEDFATRTRKNILHVAAQYGQEHVVKYLVESPQKFEHLFNAKDNDGNTPLHLATLYKNPSSVLILAKGKDVGLHIVNNAELTPYDEAEKQSKELEGETSNKNCNKKQTDQQEDTIPSMDSKGGDFYEELVVYSVLSNLVRQRQKSESEEVMVFEVKQLSKADIKARIDVLLVVAVLVTGAAFSGACQVPKGDKERPRVLQFYFLFDFLSLIASTLAIPLRWVQLTGTKLSTPLLWLASFLVGLSIVNMLAAFLCALVIDAGDNSVVYAIVLTVGVSFFFIFLIILLPLFLPHMAQTMLETFLSPITTMVIVASYKVLLKLQDLRIRCKKTARELL